MLSTLAMLVSIVAATCVLIISFEVKQTQALPMDLHSQFQAALQKVSVLNGNGTFEDCCDIHNAVTQVFKEGQPDNGIFSIPDVCGRDINGFLTEIPTTQARCDFDNDGGWTVILRRAADVQQKLNFSRSWNDYEKGFGNLDNEFWYGLRNIHCLTTREEVELQIEVKQEDGNGQVWTYRKFMVDGPENNYTLHIAQAEGPSNGYNGMTYHYGMQFTTTDADNDKKNSGNCAREYNGGGWWYNNCIRSVLTGSHDDSNLFWYNSQSVATYYPYAEMKVRPKRCKSESSRPQCDTEPPESQLHTPCGVGWRRLAYLNMSDPEEQCPSPWTEFLSGGSRMCFRVSAPGCDSVMYSSGGRDYSQVCGRVIGYQYGNSHGFYPYHKSGYTLETYYIDGISVTYGQTPRTHIWTFAAGFSERDDDLGSCPCGSPASLATVPPYIGNNYFCETGSTNSAQYGRFYSDDPLWDGSGCGSGHSCECTLNSPPWFKVQLSHPTSEDIEIRNCGYESESRKNVGIQTIEIYVK